jgi:ribose 1,5-bisphosphokinase
MSTDASRPGTLVLVVGGSGVGKDTIIRGAQSVLARDNRYVFPRRYITRASDDVTEDHVPVTPAQFNELQARDGLAISWRAHGLDYALPASIKFDLEAGRVVVCNVSRHSVSAARSSFSDIVVVEVCASDKSRALRLAMRMRESNADIVTRLARDFSVPLHVDHLISNEGAPTEAISAFVNLLITLRD